jgi:glycosyltransferase involved in cell wall biosynthesis
VSDAATNPRVLVVADYYLPGFRAGGPIKAIANSISHLAGQTSFFVVTRDHDTDGVPYDDARSGCWNGGRDAAVYYAPRFTVAVLERCVRESQADVIWLNSFFSRASLRVLWSRRLGRIEQPVLLAPRGEFSPGALAAKRRRKMVGLHGVTALGLLRDLHWVASSRLEADEIRAAVPAASITIVPETVSKPEPAPPWPARTTAALRLVYASRIDVKKNLEFLFETLTTVRARIHLDVIGPIDHSDYWQRCRETARRLPPNVTFEYLGEMPHEDLGRRLAQYDLLALPTLGENFGHIVVEAWAAGCPVLISDRTPWRGLADAGAGWDVPLDHARWVDVLERSAALDDAELRRMRHSAVARARSIWRDGMAGLVTFQQLIVALAPPGTGANGHTVTGVDGRIPADVNSCG